MSYGLEVYNTVGLPILTVNDSIPRNIASYSGRRTTYFTWSSGNQDNSFDIIVPDVKVNDRFTVLLTTTVNKIFKLTVQAGDGLPMAYSNVLVDGATGAAIESNMLSSETVIVDRMRTHNVQEIYQEGYRPIEGDYASNLVDASIIKAGRVHINWVTENTTYKTNTSSWTDAYDIVYTHYALKYQLEVYKY